MSKSKLSIGLANGASRKSTEGKRVFVKSNMESEFVGLDEIEGGVLENPFRGGSDKKYSVLMVTPELSPFAKMGGLGDMVSGLSKALSKLGNDVRIVMPLYGCIELDTSWTPYQTPLGVHLGKLEFAKIWEGSLPGSTVKVYFIEFHKYFHRHEIYTGPWGAHADNHERFTFLSRAAVDICYYLNWIPDVVHCHDWTTGLVPVYLNTREYGQQLGRAGSVMTIHNMQHQGIFGKEVIDFAGLPWSTYRADCLESVGCVNMLKGGLFNANKITTVSPTYAEEIKRSEFGYGLENVLKFRGGDLIGILNGIDGDEWNPRTTSYLRNHFSVEDLSGKLVCKKEIQERFGLEVDNRKPIFVAIARMYEQKGLDLLADIIPDLLRDMEIQILVMGQGEGHLQNWFSYLGSQYRGRLGVYIGYDHKLAHEMIGGGDFFIMPSRFEPCGLTQLYAMAYGTLPVVRGTGGLVDTVEQYKEGAGGREGSGFCFYEGTPKALYYTIGWACATYYDRHDEYLLLQKNAMRKDFSWHVSANKYTDVYSWCVK